MSGPHCRSCTCDALDVDGALARLGLTDVRLTPLERRLVAAVDDLAGRADDGIAPYSALALMLYGEPLTSQADKQRLRAHAWRCSVALAPRGLRVLAEPFRGYRLVQGLEPRACPVSGGLEPCPECGLRMRMGAARCSECRVKLEAARSRELRVCACGGRKHPKAETCRVCFERDREARRRLGRAS